MLLIGRLPGPNTLETRTDEKELEGATDFSDMAAYWVITRDAEELQLTRESHLTHGQVHVDKGMVINDMRKDKFLIVLPLWEAAIT